MRRAIRQPATIVAASMLLITIAVVAITPLLPTYDPFTQHLSQSLTPPFTRWATPLGADPLGRDLLSRLALAGRTSIVIACASLALSLGLGAGLGLAAGYFGGIVETLVMGVADLQLAIPIMLLLVMLVARLGPSTPTLILVLGLTTWVGYARVARLAALSLRGRDFVLNARIQGASSLWILSKHLLPMAAPQLVILASFNLGVLVILESGLSYLGLGVPPPTPTWGAMISQGQDFLQIAPFLCLLPGAAICLFVSAVQILSQRLSGEGVINTGGTP
jgi:peptide/nickel transport system permease protein